MFELSNGLHFTFLSAAEAEKYILSSFSENPQVLGDCSGLECGLECFSQGLLGHNWLTNTITNNYYHQAAVCVCECVSVWVCECVCGGVIHLNYSTCHSSHSDLVGESLQEWGDGGRANGVVGLQHGTFPSHVIITCAHTHTHTHTWACSAVFIP